MLLIILVLETAECLNNETRLLYNIPSIGKSALQNASAHNRAHSCEAYTSFPRRLGKATLANVNRMPVDGFVIGPILSAVGLQIIAFHYCRRRPPQTRQYVTDLDGIWYKPGGM